MNAPPSREAWRADGELNGHSVDQTLRYLSACADYQDELDRRRALPVGVILADCEPKWLSTIRGWLGR